MISDWSDVLPGSRFRLNANAVRRAILFAPITIAAALFSVCAAQAESASQSDINDAEWLAKFQSTYIWQKKPAFHADYSGPNSFRDDAEKGYTFSGTAFLGVRPRTGTEIYFDPEVVQGAPLSNLMGLAGAPNGEAQKVAGTNPKLYRARLFLRQTFNLGGEPQTVEEGFNQFATNVDANRVVVTFGNFALNDIFDGNSFAHDPRTQFLNWTLMEYGAWDFAADARGFTNALAVEWYCDEWALRLARAEVPIESNSLPLNSRIFAAYGDNAEIERDYQYRDLPGKIRALFYRNVATMGTYAAANKLALATASVPDIANVREHRAKTGYGVSIEQNITNSAGFFARYSADDGEGEEYNFTEVDRSMQAGISVKGDGWSRAGDIFGLAFVKNDLSSAHRTYLALGGLGFFLGDGQLSDYRSENIVEAYYNAQVLSELWLTLDYQHIANPGYNADRGPVSVFSARIHAEF